MIWFSTNLFSAQLPHGTPPPVTSIIIIIIVSYKVFWSIWLENGFVNITEFLYDTIDYTVVFSRLTISHCFLSLTNNEFEVHGSSAPWRICRAYPSLAGQTQTYTRAFTHSDLHKRAQTETRTPRTWLRTDVLFSINFDTSPCRVRVPQPWQFSLSPSLLWARRLRACPVLTQLRN